MSHRRKKHAIHGISGSQHTQPIRAEDLPFCAYFGPQGQTCSETTNLVQVLRVEGKPALVWLACPKHRNELQQLAQVFLQQVQHTPVPLALKYHNVIGQVLVTPKMKLHD